MIIAFRNVMLVHRRLNRSVVISVQSRGGSLCGKRGTMCKFESKEVCNSLRFHNINLSARGRER